MYRSTCRGGFSNTYMTAEGKALKEQYQWEAKSQWKGKPLQGDVEVSVTLYFSRRGKHDWDNFHKLWADALTGIVWEDDGQVKKARVTVEYDKARPRIEIGVQLAV